MASRGALHLQATAPHPGTARPRHPGWPSGAGDPVLSHFRGLNRSHLGPVRLPQLHLWFPPLDLVLGGVHRLGGGVSHLTSDPSRSSR